MQEKSIRPTAAMFVDGPEFFRYLHMGNILTKFQKFHPVVLEELR